MSATRLSQDLQELDHELQYMCEEDRERQKSDSIQSPSFFTEDLWFLSGMTTVLLQDLTGMNHRRMAAK